jgi:hypothetical protein
LHTLSPWAWFKLIAAENFLANTLRAPATSQSKRFQTNKPVDEFALQSFRSDHESHGYTGVDQPILMSADRGEAAVNAATRQQQDLAL